MVPDANRNGGTSMVMRSCPGNLGSNTDMKSYPWRFHSSSRCSAILYAFSSLVTSVGDGGSSSSVPWIAYASFSSRSRLWADGRGGGVYAFGAALEDAVVRYRCPGIGLFACVQQREEGGALASEPLFVGHAVTSSLVKAYRTVMFTSVSAHVCIRPLHVTNRHVSSGSSSMISASMASSCRLGMASAMSRPRLAVSRCV